MIPCGALFTAVCVLSVTAALATLGWITWMLVEDYRERPR